MDAQTSVHDYISTTEREKEIRNTGSAEVALAGLQSDV